jgi:hypothetical protein
MGVWREAAMDDAGVTIVDGEVRIDHPKIEAGLRQLAAVWNVTVEEALRKTLQRALADIGSDTVLPEIPEDGAS